MKTSRYAFDPEADVELLFRSQDAPVLIPHCNHASSTNMATATDLPTQVAQLDLSAIQYFSLDAKGSSSSLTVSSQHSGSKSKKKVEKPERSCSDDGFLKASHACIASFPKDDEWTMEGGNPE